MNPPSLHHLLTISLGRQCLLSLSAFTPLPSNFSPSPSSHTEGERMKEGCFTPNLKKKTLLALNSLIKREKRSLGESSLKSLYS